MSTSSRTIKWVESLADQENLIHAGERQSVDIFLTKDEVLRVETMSFVQDLFHYFEYLVSLFNGRIAHPSDHLRLLRTDSPEQFSVQRGVLKLSIGVPQPGVIQIQCDKTVIDQNSRLSRPSMMFSGRGEARFGTFHDVEWYFLGNRVNAELLARHYLTEFIQSSREPANT